MSTFEQRAKWSEFDWERELRKDDARIASYMAELPKFIDLPDEDKVIMNSLKKHPELAPTGGDWSEIGPIQPLPDDEFEEEEAEDIHDDNWQDADGGYVYSVCANLARDWALVLAEAKDSGENNLFLRILASYGKIMARSGELIDMSLEESDENVPTPVPLKIATCKRLLRDINEALGELGKVQSEPEYSRTVAHMEALRNVHDNVIDILFRYRESHG